MRYAIYILLEVLCLLLQVLSYAIIANALLSWFMPMDNPIRRVLMRVCEPFIYPFRRLTRRFMTTGMPIDVSPMLAYLAIQLVSGLITRYVIPYI